MINIRYKMSSVKFMAYLSRLDPLMGEVKGKIGEVKDTFNNIKHESLEGLDLREFLEKMDNRHLMMMEKGSNLKNRNFKAICRALLKTDVSQHRMLTDREKEYR